MLQEQINSARPELSNEKSLIKRKDENGKAKMTTEKVGLERTVTCSVP